MADHDSETRQRLTLQPPRDTVVAARMDAIRERIIDLGEHLEMLCPPSRELSLALTHLEEVCFWSIGSVARNQSRIHGGVNDG